jgi:replication factor C subunit 3/5
MLNLYEKYKVKNFNQFDISIQKHYSNIINIFKSLSKENLPNILLYGEPGSGKLSLLYSFFNDSKKRRCIQSYKTTSSTIEYILYKSNDFIELDLDELGIYKKYILRDIIKDFILTKKVINNKNKIVIIHNIHLLSVDDQFILRKIIEEHIINCRFILLSNTINNLLEPIKSRCLVLKTPGFTKNIIKEKLETIIKNENIKITDSILKNILNDSGNNLKKAILELNTYNNTKNINDDYLLIKSESINNILYNLLNYIKTSNIKYKEVDEILYKLLINYKIEATYIMRILYKLLNNSLNYKQRIKIINLNYKYNKYLISASKKIIYLQSYIYELSNILN